MVPAQGVGSALPVEKPAPGALLEPKAQIGVALNVAMIPLGSAKSSGTLGWRICPAALGVSALKPFEMPSKI